MVRRSAAAPIAAAVLALAFLGGCDVVHQPAGRYAGGPAAAASARSVTVVQGDTVYALARRHGVSVRALIETNALRPPYHLYQGQTIYLPTMAEHVVVAGDTVSQIARTYGVPISELVRANGLSDPSLIRVGQRLRLPSAVAAAEPPPPAAVARAAVPPPPAKPSSPPLPMQAAAAPPPPQIAAPVAAGPRAPLPEPPRLSGGFIWPARGEVIARFGPQGKGLHNDGINIALPRGAPVHAVADGVVAYAGNELRGFGWLLLIKHGDGWMSAYAHADELLVARGAEVKRGQPVARAGTTGNVRTPQLHFQLRRGATPVDPMPHLPSAQAAR